MASESKKVVFFAVGANIAIASAKAIGGLVTGSNAMWAEAAHSLADTTNQIFMLVSISLARRLPDDEHPFGYGKERFFWAFLAAVFTFVSGAVFSVYKGVGALVAGDSPAPAGAAFVFSYLVLAVAFLADGTSWMKAFFQTRKDAKRARLPFGTYVWEGKNPTVKVVLLEDSAALLGVIVAATGLVCYQVTGNVMFDAGASIVIGLLLASVAIGLGWDTKSLLLGEAALPEDRRRIHRIIAEHEGVEHVCQVLTMAVGPHSIVVAARVHLRESLTAKDIEQLAFHLDQKLREAIPTVRDVFLDPTSRTEPPWPTMSRAEQLERAADDATEPATSGEAAVYPPSA